LFIGLGTHYKDNDSEIGKWLKRCFGLHFLEANDEDSFEVDIISECSSDPKCEIIVQTF
jgi:hypothetical protein